MNLMRYLLIAVLSLALFGCSSNKPAPNPNLTWAINLSNYEVKDNLKVVQTTTGYDGTQSDEVHQQSPAVGNVYLIMKLTIKNQNASSNSFDWSKLIIRDNTGKTYQRNKDDTFLDQYNYSPRMTSLVLTSGSYEGWVCYEILKQAADGKLTLTYNVEGSQQEIVVK